MNSFIKLCALFLLAKLQYIILLELRRTLVLHKFIQQLNLEILHGTSTFKNE